MIDPNNEGRTAERPIIVVDDEAEFCTLLSDVAASVGKSTHTFQSAVQFLASDIPDNALIILDLMMPDLDGIEVIRALATRKLDISLILISGFDQRVLHSAQRLAELSGIKVEACFSKPLPILEFRKLFERKRHPGRSSEEGQRGKKYSEDEIRRGIEDHQFVLYYQPQVNLQTNLCVGMEGLVRWNHPFDGLVYPGAFIGVAEKTGVIKELSQEIIDIAAFDVAENQNVLKPYHVSINISPKTITQLTLPEQLSKMHSNFSIPENMLVLELTETAVMGELKQALDVLSRLRMKGYQLSIDDFGTGYSSLGQLYNAPFSELKVDQQFVSKMIKDKEARAIVEMCLTLGKMLGMKVVAEGIENAETFEALKNLGCDIGQGFFISRPLALTDLLVWLEEKSNAANTN